MRKIPPRNSYRNKRAAMLTSLSLLVIAVLAFRYGSKFLGWLSLALCGLNLIHAGLMPDFLSAVAALGSMTLSVLFHLVELFRPDLIPYRKNG